MTAQHAPGAPDQPGAELVPAPHVGATALRQDLTARAESWCQAVGECPLPADPLTVARFVTDLAPRWRPATPADPPEMVNAGQVRQRDMLRRGTLAGYLAAVSVVHQTAQRENPTSSEAVRRVMAGIRRHPGLAPPRRRAAARRDPLVAVLQTPRPEEHLADARDHALLLIGWKAALRTDDLARLSMADLHSSEKGLSVRLRRSKTDQTGHGTTIGIAGPATTSHTGDDEAGTRSLLDAGAGWARWRDRLGARGILDGPAWRAIDRYGRRPRTGGLHRNSIAEVIKRHARAAGLDDAQAWGGHRRAARRCPGERNSDRRCRRTAQPDDRGGARAGAADRDDPSPGL